MTASLLILLLTFLILLGLRVPIAFSIGLSGLLVLLLNIPADIAFTTFAQRMATGLDSFTLTAIPMLILAGELMNRGGMATRLINLARVLLRRLPGGLMHVNILACMLFGAISGSAVAAASAIGGFMTPQMEKEGYSRESSAATNIASSVTGLIIPPSNVLIIYAMASGGASIAALFLAGYLPGLLLGLALMIVVALCFKKSPAHAAAAADGNPWRDFLEALPSLFLLVLIIGGIVSGIFTATEASAIAVLYAFILALVIYKELDWAGLRQVLISSGQTTGIVMLLIAGSAAMSWVMSYEHIPQQVSDTLLGISDNKIAILLMINLILLLVGTFMDITPAILIFTPIFLPVVQNLGVNTVHFGMIMVMNLCIGICTPPVGSVLFVGSSVAGLKIQQVIRPLLPLFVAMLLVLMLVTFIPDLSLWIPRIFGF